MKKILVIILVVFIFVHLTACNETAINSNGENDNIINTTQNIKNTNTNDSGLNNSKPICTTHNYINNICSVCNCSLWSGNVDTSWYNVIDSEFTITTAEQFAGLIDIVNGGSDLADSKIYLENHIDLNCIPITPIGATSKNIYAGTFDANGYAVTNVKITTQSVLQEFKNTSGRGDMYECRAGLFGYLTGKILNANVINIDIDITASDNCTLCVGGLVGENNGEISNCSVNGRITISGKDSFDIGGVIGRSEGGTIAQTNSKVDITTAYAVECGEIWRYFRIGGAIGLGRGVSLDQCYSDGSIVFSSNGDENHTFMLGGMIGELSLGKSFVTNSYSYASVKGNGRAEGIAGGLIGRVYTTTFDSCYSIGSVNIKCAYGEAAGLIGHAESLNGLSKAWTASDVEMKSEQGKVASIVNIYDDITSCYYLNTQSLIGAIIDKNGTPVSIDDVKNIKFYTNRMPWDADIWNIVDGKYPVLK